MYEDRDRPDVFDYLNDRDLEGIDTEPAHEASLRDLENVLATYVISKDDENIEEYEYRYITVVRIYSLIRKCGDMYQSQGEESMEAFIEKDDVNPDDAEDVADRIGRYTVGNNVMVIYTLGYELIKDLMGDLLLEILDEDEATEMGKEQLQNRNQNYQTRADLLQHFELIDDSYRGDIARIRENRRDLVHDVERRFDLKMLDDINDLWNIIHVINHLYEKLYDRPAYRFIDGNED